MITKQAAKINIASLQVLRTLQVLMEDNYEMSELIEILNTNNGEKPVNHSVVSKYINSCRYCGIEIPKIHNKYYVASLPFGLDLTIQDINLLGNLRQIARNLLSKKQIEVFEKFLAKINKFSNKKIANVQNKNQEDILKVFKEAVEEERCIQLMLRTREILICSPVQIVKSKNKLFFNVYMQNKEKLVSVDRVVGIEILNQGKFYKIEREAVVFKVTGKLAERYTLKDGEILTEFGPGYKVISNESENREILISRILRYDSCCEILKPVAFREEVKSIIEKTLSNYGV